jgi:hypothetical protein
MRSIRAIAAVLALFVAVASPAGAQTPPPSGVKVGTLGCVLSPTIGIVVGSFQTLKCTFKPDGPYPPEEYVGSFGTLGLDIGLVGVGGLAWAVYNQVDAGPLRNALAGTYVGASGEIGVGVGVGANVLIGGSNRQVALQPVSLYGEIAVNLELGISTLILRPAY